ncbi:hypothetical protein [Aeromicrobium sp.]|uniref:hypothetical protein n=1 Tax=Aeromicrobium sp. TaxID=1871063 RepID=UPI003D6A006F
MMHAVAGLITTVLAVSTLTACGGDSPYCTAVKDQKTTLNSLGENRTTAAYRSYARAFRSVAKVSPPAVKKDWTELAEVTASVLNAQDKVGIKLEEMSDVDRVKKLSTGQLKSLNNAYEAFNKTTQQRRAVVKNVKQECEITLT